MAEVGEKLVISTCLQCFPMLVWWPVCKRDNDVQSLFVLKASANESQPPGDWVCADNAKRLFGLDN